MAATCGRRRKCKRPARDIAAQVSGLKPEQVKIHSQFMGGGFGRRGSVDYVAEVVEIAKAVKIPVKLTWSREDDMQHDQYRPAAMVKFTASLDASGMPIGAGSQSRDAAVRIRRRTAFPVRRWPASRISSTRFPTYWWLIRAEKRASRSRTGARRAARRTRSVSRASSMNSRSPAKKDPLEYRRAMLKDSPRLLGALNLAAEKANWGKAPAGRFQGIGLINNIGSYTAMIAEVSVTSGKLKIHKLTCAIDCGHVVNPLILRQQVEGGAVYGLTAALKGAITIDKGPRPAGQFQCLRYAAHQRNAGDRSPHCAQYRSARRRRGSQHAAGRRRYRQRYFRRYRQAPAQTADPRRRSGVAPRSGMLDIKHYADRIRSIDNLTRRDRLRDSRRVFFFVVAVGWLVRRRVRTSEDFLTSHRSVPLWITSLAFIAANLGAQEVMGMCASGAKYGLMTVHFYWIGAIPAMIFIGVFMMPFYYGSRARSVPEYLKLRFDEKTRALNATSFAVMTVFSSGISLYALGKLFQLLLGWSFEQSVLLSAAVVWFTRSSAA